MPVNISGSGSITGLSVGGLENGIITPSELSTGGPSWDATGNVQVSGINGGPLAGFRSAIVNGSFDHWQRGTSFTAFAYGADRWANSRAGTTCTMSRQPFTLGQTDVPGEPTYFCRMAVTSVAGAGNLSAMYQPIEGVRTFAGQQATISFWAKADASKSIAIEFQQSFGTGGSPSSSVTAIGSVKKALTTSWQKITHAVTIPSIAGKTLGTDGNDSLVLHIWFDAGSSFNSRTDTLGQQSGTFDIAQVQVEAGPVATPFERRPIGVELALCQRYYEKGQQFFIGYQAASNSVGDSVRFSTDKRGVPSVVATNVSIGANVSATPVINHITSSEFSLYHALTSTSAVTWRDTWTADAEL